MEFKEFSEEAKRSYIAGFIDGEGTISMQIINLIKSRNKMVNPIYYVYINISNTKKEVLNNICEYAGGYVSKLNRKDMKINWKDQYRLVIKSKKAVDLIRKIIPYLIIKVEQAKLALKFDEFRKLEKIKLLGIKGHVGSNPYNKSVIFAFNSYKQNMNVLNKRGREVRE